ncbi:MAG: hypothetical protein AAF600_16045, partial [Bacteroidota bacterium]
FIDPDGMLSQFAWGSAFGISTNVLGSLYSESEAARQKKERKRIYDKINEVLSTNGEEDDEDDENFDESESIIETTPEGDIQEYEKNERTVIRNSMITDVLSNLTTFGQLNNSIELVITEWKKTTGITTSEEERESLYNDISLAMLALGITVTSSYPEIKVAATLITTPLATQNVYLESYNKRVLSPRIKRDSPWYYNTNITPKNGERIHYTSGGGGASAGWR